MNYLNLARIAVNSAVDVERVLAGKTSANEMAEFPKLISFLDLELPLRWGDGSPSALAVTVMHRAELEAGNFDPNEYQTSVLIRTNTETRARLKQLIEPDSRPSTEDLLFARDFCLALSRVALPMSFGSHHQHMAA